MSTKVICSRAGKSSACKDCAHGVDHKLYRHESGLKASCKAPAKCNGKWVQCLKVAKQELSINI